MSAFTIIALIVLLVFGYFGYQHITKTNRALDDQMDRLFDQALAEAQLVSDDPDSPRGSDAWNAATRSIANNASKGSLNQMHRRLKGQHEQATRKHSRAQNLEQTTAAEQALERQTTRMSMIEDAMKQLVNG